MKTRVLLVVAVPALALAGCIGNLAGSVDGTPGEATPPGAGPGPTDPLPPPPFEAVSPAAAAAKVKDVLTGLPLAGDELAAVSDDRAALRGLIDAWMGLPQFKEKMLEFWKSAFQQTQLDVTDLDEQLRLDSADVNRADQRRMLTSVEESFTRTVMALVDEGRPFTETVTTTRFMLNLPLMVALSYMDAAPRNDTGRAVASGFWLMNKYGGQSFRMTMVTGLDPLTGARRQHPHRGDAEPRQPELHEVELPAARSGPLHALRRAGDGDGDPRLRARVRGAVRQPRRLPGRAQRALAVHRRRLEHLAHGGDPAAPRRRGAHRLLGPGQAARPRHHASWCWPCRGSGS